MGCSPSKKVEPVASTPRDSTEKVNSAKSQSDTDIKAKTLSQSDLKTRSGSTVGLIPPSRIASASTTVTVVDQDSRQSSATSKDSGVALDEALLSRRKKQQLDGLDEIRKPRRNEFEELAALREEGLISQPKSKSSGFSFEIAGFGRNSIDENTNSPRYTKTLPPLGRLPPRLAKLEMRSRDKKVLTEDEIKEKLAKAERRRKKREERMKLKLQELANRPVSRSGTSADDNGSHNSNHSDANGSYSVSSHSNNDKIPLSPDLSEKSSATSSSKEKFVKKFRRSIIDNRETENDYRYNSDDFIAQDVSELNPVSS